MRNEFHQTLELISRLDKLKSVGRQSDTLDGTRKENSAEHSWQCAAMAMLFQRFLDVPIDLQKVLTMLLIHDTGEIDAGDTSLYGSADANEQYQKELNGVRRLFEDSYPELVDVWMEFEKGRTMEAKYARAIDRIAGMLSSHFNRQSCWSEAGMSAENILARNSAVKEGIPAIWPMIEELVREADSQGRIGRETTS